MFTYSIFPNTSFKSELLVLLFPEKELKESLNELELIKSDYIALIKNVINNADFRGELKENLLLYPPNDNSIKRILLIGYGKIDKFDSEKLREIGFLIGKKQSDLKAKNIHVVINHELNEKEKAIKAIAEGILYSGYLFQEFKSEKKDKTIRATVSFLSLKEEIKNNFNGEFKKILAVNEGIIFTRNLANIPANYLTPRILQKKVRNQFKDIKSVKIDATAEDDISDIHNVTLFYLKPEFDDWKEFETDYNYPYSWDFTIDDDEGGEIELCTIATDLANNREDFPTTGDISFIFDPNSIIQKWIGRNHGLILTFSLEI